MCCLKKDQTSMYDGLHSFNPCLVKFKNQCSKNSLLYCHPTVAIPSRPQLSHVISSSSLHP